MPVRSNPVPVDRYVTPLGSVDWKELPGFPSGHTQETPNYNRTVPNLSRIGQGVQNEGYHSSNTSVDERHRKINHIAASYTQACYNVNGGWNTNQVANILARRNSAALTSANRIPVRSTTSPGNQPLSPDFHSQANNWRESNLSNLLLHNQAHYSSSNLLQRSNSFQQSPQYGFPITYGCNYKQNSPPRTETDAVSSITTALLFSPVTPDPVKNLESNQMSTGWHFPTATSSNKEKENQESLIAATGNEAIQHNHNDLLQNVVPSAVISTLLEEKRDYENGSSEGIDLNKTPQQKPPKRRKHRPKVAGEGKAKRTRKAETPKSTGPGEKRKYVRRKGLEESATQKADTMRGTNDPSARPVAKSCRRVLNFGLEKNGDESQGAVVGQQEEMQQSYKRNFNLNLDSQATELDSRSYSGCRIVTSTLLGQQNGLAVEHQQTGTVTSHTHTINQIPDYTSMQERQAVAASLPPIKGLHTGNLDVIASNIDTRIADPFQQSNRTGYVSIQQNTSADGIGHTVFQAKSNFENLERTRQLMPLSTLQSVPTILSGSKEAGRSKREYSHAMQQTQPHAVNIMDSSFLNQNMVQIDGFHRNTSSIQGADCSETYKKRKNENGLHTIITGRLSRLTTEKDASRQARTKLSNNVNGNGFIVQADYDALNFHSESSKSANRENSEHNKLFTDCNGQLIAHGHYLLKNISSKKQEKHSCTEKMVETNRLTAAHAFASSSPSEKHDLVPPTPPGKAPAPEGRRAPKACRVSVSVKKNIELPLARSFSSEMDQVLLKQRQAFADQQNYSAKKEGPALKQIFPIPMDEIIHRFNDLNLNARANQESVQEQNAIVPYKQDGTVVPYEGFEFIKKRKPRPKVDLDPETTRIWNLLMGNEGSEGLEQTDKEKEKWWEEERRVFKGRADSFIARMHLVQGDRRFSKWKGSVVDSVIGVFLTQNVSDHLSSSAFMSLAARFPLKSNKRTCNMDGTNILVEEPEVCVLSPNESIQWHEQVIRHPLNSQISLTPHEPTEHHRESEASGVEEIISSQDSFTSSILQNNGGIRSYSDSNSEAEDSPSGCKPDNASTNVLQESNTTLVQGFYSFIDKSLLFQERYHGHKRSEDIENIQQESGLDCIDNLDSSLTFTQLLNFNDMQPQVPLIPSGNHQLHMTSFSELLEAEVSEVYTGEFIPSWPSVASEFPMAKDGNNARTGQLVEDIAETMVQQHRQPMPKEMPTGSPYALLSMHSMQQQNVSLPISHSKYNQPYNDIHQHGRTETFQCESISVTQPVHHADPAKQQNGIMQQVPSDPKLAEKTGHIGDRMSVANKLSENKLVEPNSGKQVLSTHKANDATSPKISKSKKGKANGEKKNAIDWDSLRKEVQSNSRKKERSRDTMDSLDYEAVRCATVKEISDAIKERGMNNMLAERIKEFLNRLVKDHGSIDLEWLRDVPPDKAKDYLLSMRGLGLKSVECVRLLTLHHLAFPVDTNVGRIAVRLGWVPLQPLPESLQLHLLELYPILESIQKYLWPRLCKLDQRTLYELHYQLITFGKVFCTKSKPNCNACPMRGECRHFASAFASARLALPGPEEKTMVSSMVPTTAERNPAVVINPMQLPSSEKNSIKEAGREIGKCEPIIEEPATPEQECTEITESDIEDTFYEDPDEIPTIKLNIEEFTVNLQNYMQEKMELQECDMSKALVALNPEAASIPAPKLKNVSRLRTEHQVYELPDSHPLLEGMDRREPDDPSPYLLAMWTPGETANSIQPPESRCGSQESGKLCDDTTCFSCNSVREANSQTVRGTILIPCRTAMRGSFPLNGTYFQVNEVFADHNSSLNPIDVPRQWIWNLPRRMVYFGTSVSTIFKGLSTEGIQYCFWKGFVCVRGFDQKTRAPRPLMARLHFPASKLTKAKNEKKNISRP
ncbi:transcriptional activator DEMETER-like [Melia azedarach]|nr:transcriptional activator DEMETER-like [Melia azedarach]